MSQHMISNSLINVILVLAESVITLVLRFNPSLRKAMYPLAKKNVIVCIRSYLPHTEVFATFTTKGILLDTELPDNTHQVDVVINAYSHQLINTLIGSDPTQINKLTIRGESENVAEIRHFLVQLGVASLFQSIIRSVKGKDKEHHAESENKPDYKARIEEQQEQLNVLSMRNRELEISLKEAESKQKLMLISLIVASLIAVAAVVGWAL